MLITHDLGVIAEMADYVVVMYAGRVVEKGTASEIFKNPSHPYTIGLMRSKPVVGKKVDKLYSIPGKVPNPIDMPDYCYFRDRCELSCDKCQGSYPGVIKLSPTHEVAVTAMQTVRKQDGWQMFIQGKGEKLMSENKTAENTKNQQSDNILEVSHLKKYFPIKGGMFGKQVGAVKAVDDVSFTLKRGTTMGLVGESGCGKSTTGRTILRLIEETERTGSLQTEKMFTVFQ